MKRIPTLFLRDERHQITPEVDPDCQWVIDGEGIATVKWDGTACLMREGRLYRRYRVRRDQTVPLGWFAADGAIEHGWLPIGDGPADRYHRKALAGSHPNSDIACGVEGTYELVGPHVQGNPYDLPHHRLWRHGFSTIKAPTDFDMLRTFLGFHPREGIVWHHPDGNSRMAKIKRRDFGLQWPLKEQHP